MEAIYSDSGFNGHCSLVTVKAITSSAPPVPLVLRRCRPVPGSAFDCRVGSLNNGDASADPAVSTSDRIGEEEKLPELKEAIADLDPNRFW